MCACVGWCARGLVSPFSPIEPIVSHCLPTRVPVLDGASAFSTPCLSFLSPIVSPHVCLCWMGSCLICLCWTVCLPSRGLVSPCLLSPMSPHTCACVWWCVRLHDVLSPLFVSHCHSPRVCLWWYVCLMAFPPSRGLVSPCLPLSPHNIRLCWMVCPPSQGLVSPCIFHCLPPPFLFPFLGWCAPPFQGLVSLVSTCPPLFPILSHCLPTCVPVLDGVSAFPSSSLPFSPIEPIVSHCLPLSAHTCACVGWRVRLFDVLSSLLSPHMCACVGWGLVLSACVGRCVRLLEVLSPLVSHMCACVGWCLSLGWCVRLPAVLSPRVCLCWMVCPPSRGLVSPCLPSPFLFPFVGWCVRLLDVLPLVSHCLLTCEPVWDGLSASPRSCLHLSSIASHCPPNCLPLSPFLSPRLPLSPVAFHCFPLSPHMCACAGWCVRLRRSCLPIVSHCFPALVCPRFGSYPPSRGLVSPCLPLSPHMCACVGCCARLPEVLSPFVSHCLPLSPHMCACVGRCVPHPKVLSPLVSYCFPTCVPVTFCVGWCVRLPAVLSPS